MESGFEDRGAGGRRVSAALWVVLVFLTFSAFSQNLVQNGNFDANGGSFEDWQVGHSAQLSSYSGPNIASPGYNGNPYYAQFLFEWGGHDTLSQDIATTPGDVYDLIFAAEDGGGHDIMAEVNFGDFSDNLLNAFSIGPGEWYMGWTNFSFDVTATEAESDLSFEIAADTGSEFGVDDVAVVQVPLITSARAGSSYYVSVSSPDSPTIVQASTNLVDWQNIFTNTPPFTFTDSISQFPQRFYRAAVIVAQNQ